MNKNFKRLLSAVLSAAVVSAGAAVPVLAEDYTPLFAGDTVLNEWKFEFGRGNDAGGRFYSRDAL